MACTATLTGRGGPVLSVVFHPMQAAVLASASDDHTVKLWDVSSELLGASAGAISRDHFTPFAAAWSSPAARRAAAAVLLCEQRLYNNRTFAAIPPPEVFVHILSFVLRRDLGAKHSSTA